MRAERTHAASDYLVNDRVRELAHALYLCFLQSVDWVDKANLRPALSTGYLKNEFQVACPFAECRVRAETRTRLE